MNGINRTLAMSNPEWACQAIDDVLYVWWHVRGILGGMRWTIEEGDWITSMDDRVKDLDPSFLPERGAA